MPAPIIITRPTPIASPTRLRTRQVRARILSAGGPQRARLTLTMYRPSDQEYRLVDRPYIILAPTPAAFELVRARLDQLMRELDGMIPPDPTDPQDEPTGPPRALTPPHD